ncbi:MAG: MFS transporter, partial [Gammaproteobacteria bacterium]
MNDPVLTEPKHGTQPQNSPYGWYVVGILILAYTFSYVDRTILTLLVKPIRESLQISDTQLSLLHGLAFAIFYTGLGIPIARLADRRDRT